MSFASPDTSAETPSKQTGKTKAATKRIRFDLPLLALLAVLFLINFPYWNATFMVGHDTKNVYLVFHYFYNHLFLYGELPRWLPFGEYGYNSLFYQLCDFSPSTYLAGLLGYLLRIKDSLLLFKMAVFGDQLVFLLGLHLLTRRLYERRLTSFIVCFLGLTSVIWTWQIYWSLRQFYLLPLVLYFFHRFIVDRTSWCFWLSLLTLLFALVGGLPYWAPIYAFMFIVMTLILLPTYWRSFSSLLHPKLTDATLITLLILCGCAFGYVVTTCLANLHNYAPGRSLNEMRTNLQTYLTYISPVWGQLHAFLDGTMPSKPYYLHDPEDLTLYVGLLSIVGFVAAFFRGRSIWFLSLAGAMSAMALLADSGAISWVLYWLFPGLNLFRHLGLLLEIVKVLLLLAGGFGIELIIGYLSDKEQLAKRFHPALYLALLACLCLILDSLVAGEAYKPNTWLSPMVMQSMLPEGGIWVIIRLTTWAMVLTLIFILARTKKLTRTLPFASLPYLLTFACIVDMTCFQLYHWHNRSTGEYVGQLMLEPVVFNEARKIDPSAGDIQKQNILMTSPGGAYLAFYANALQNDLCVPWGRVDIFPKGVHELVSARGASPTQQTIQRDFLPPNDMQLLKVMGCETPKIRFISQAQFGTTDNELRNLVRGSPALDTTVILRGNQASQPVISQRLDPNPMAYAPRFFNANRLDLEVAVKPGNSGWLVYADAFDPQWKAYVNGRETPIVEAYMAFKAIYLNEGNSVVSFRFENTRQKYAMGLLLVVGICLATGCLVGLGYQIVRSDKA